MKKDAQKIMGTPDPSYHPLLERISYKKKNLTTPHFQKHDQDQWLYKPSKGHQQSKMLYILKNWHLEFSDAPFRAW